jgi:hypothetical protein
MNRVILCTGEAWAAFVLLDETAAVLFLPSFFSFPTFPES